ncbi:alkaline phosphatase D family protein [Novosphingobium sp.]|uniref:alkaline phosphatase D family protein n=1 Tax=Novosphingobium sp. TaxID=1874826 RepID=UPI001ED3B451|nr:alkaline phosphatase D family protein [Novosphingobium sp.]MBK9011992.1 alkaline phosphatase D family protein [Novosphingobium sp.]
MHLPPPAPAPIAHADRRSALKLGLLGLAGLSAPGKAGTGGGFTHGVASGEPGAEQVLLWTRFAAAQEVVLKWEVAEDEAFSRIMTEGDALASPASDCCAKAWARGLAPGRWYYYRFIAPSGERSVTGRTRTLPVGKVPHFRIAVFSCSNYGFGWFNAYAHAAEAGDFDLALHLGDYFYEYKRGEYPSVKQTVGGRSGPLDEAVTLAGYRERLATYRADPDLQRLHQLYPMISVWDDHETANDTWQNGAENHQNGTEGDWAVRKAASEKAYRAWLPVSDDYWAKYEVGELATLFRLETRHVARSEPFELVDVVKSKTPDEAEAALKAFRDGKWRDPSRGLLGAEQEAWLAGGLRASARSNKPWQVLVQQIVMGSIAMPQSLAEGMAATSPDWLKQRIRDAVTASRVGLPWNMDAWDGYPAARDRLYKAALEARANLLVLAGDSHNAWASDLERKGRRVGVEMAGHSVTSPGAEDTIRWQRPDTLAAEVVARNPQLKWCDTAQRGYLAVELTPQAATGEWRFLATVREKGTALAGAKRMTVLAGQRKFAGG